MLLPKRGRAWTIVFSSLGCCAVGAMAAAATKPDTGTPQPRHQRYTVADREQRLAQADLKAGNPVLIRIFKQESQLELWMQRGERFVLFATYPICKWSGKLGPKLQQGDKQAPEGFYRVGADQLRLKGRNARSFYIDYPNALERALGRTGSAIMVHGGCTSIGCFAMTNPVKEEIYSLVERALHEGQNHIEVHAFPFRMTDANLAAHSRHASYAYWLNLKQGYDLFEKTRIAPKVSMCGGEYAVDAGELPGEVATLTVGTPPTRRICPQEPNVASATKVEPGSVMINRPKVVLKGSHRVAGRNARKAYAAANRARKGSFSRRAHASDAFGKTRKR
jgi:murein L,D-transpeptidase YafK